MLTLDPDRYDGITQRASIADVDTFTARYVAQKSQRLARSTYQRRVETVSW